MRGVSMVMVGARPLRQHAAEPTLAFASGACRQWRTTRGAVALADAAPAPPRCLLVVVWLFADGEFFAAARQEEAYAVQLWETEWEARQQAVLEGQGG